MKKQEYKAPDLGWRAIGAGLFCASMGGPASVDDDFEAFELKGDTGNWDTGW